MLSERTKEHMADVLAVNDNERIDPDVWSGPTLMLRLALIAAWVAFIGVLVWLYHSEWFWGLVR